MFHVEQCLECLFAGVCVELCSVPRGTLLKFVDEFVVHMDHVFVSSDLYIFCTGFGAVRMWGHRLLGPPTHAPSARAWMGHPLL